MKIFSADQIKQWDAYTIAHEPVSSIDLMERAARKCYEWISSHLPAAKYSVFCGTGNNGGDGLAIARMLIENKKNVSVYIIPSSKNSGDFETNLARLKAITDKIDFITGEIFPVINSHDIIIDALFGTGLNKSLTGTPATVVKNINKTNSTIVSIDVPSGLYPDRSSGKNVAVNADYTLSFQQYKLAFLVPENYRYFGKVVILDIGLHTDYIAKKVSKYELTDPGIIKTIYRPRPIFSHKGDFGHAGLITGSLGLMGAAVLAARACLRSGAGKLTSIVPQAGYEIIQASAPEAMAEVRGKNFIESIADPEKFTALGIGPGIGIYPSHKKLLHKIFATFKNRLVIDADALNVLSQHKNLFKKIPADTIITPHPKEFERLFGKTKDSFERINLASQIAADHNIYIILKGHYSLIATPGKCYFNSTGNPGMATGGSGDVLTGILTGLLASGYTPHQASLLGVYLHGMAGNIASGKFSEEAMIAGDITDCLGDAFKQIKSDGE